jgi:hypothetical protein
MRVGGLAARPEPGDRLAPAAPDRTAMWVGRAIVLVAVAVATVTLLAADGGMTSEYVSNSWQILDIEALADDPLGSVWYLHTQPPGYNLLVGVAAWLPVPLVGTLYAIDIVALAGIGLLLQSILVRWGVRPIAAALVAALAILNPSLLSTMAMASYEVPVCLLIVGALAAAQRYLETPRTGWLVATSALLTAGALTRSLLHPVWVVAVLAVLAVARPPARRAALVSALIPLVLVGGWMLKNQVVFGTPTMSSWLGFNMQRGVTAPMDADLVQADVTGGAVSELARERPWGPLASYERWIGECTPHDHPVTADTDKESAGVTTANYNHECYLPAYREAQRNAVTLIRRHPAEYAADRVTALKLSFVHSTTLHSGRTTWLDTAYRPLLLSVDHDIAQEDWNLPLFGEPRPFPVTISLTFAALCAFVVGRGVVAVVRLVRRGWRDRAGWPPPEVLWVLAAGTVAVVVLGGDLVEIGENTRFRSTVDPLLIALPLGASVLLAQRRRGRGDAATSGPDLPGGGWEGPHDGDADRPDRGADRRHGATPRDPADGGATPALS